MTARLAAALVLAAGSSLAACGDGGDGAGSPDAGPRPRTFGGDRPVELQIPPGADADDTARPLVVILHGYSATGLLQQAYLGLGDLAADAGVFVLAPDGTVDANGNQFWNASDACCGTGPGTDDVDDVAYLGGVIEEVAAAWPVDPSRIVTIGHSNGHFMSYRLACDRADLITAIAGLAGAAVSVDGSGCDPAAPVSSLHIHGTADDVVLYDGGAFGGAAYPGAVASVTQWQGHDGCATTRTAGAPLDLERDLDGAETVVERADGCPDGIGVELWTMTDASHIPDLQPGFGAAVVDWLLGHPRP